MRAMARAWTRIAARVALAALLAAAGAVAAALAWWRLQEPLSALPRDPPVAVSVVEERREAWGGRVLLHVAMRGETVGDVRFVVSLPDPVPAEGAPVVMVLGGLSGASRSIRRISEIAGDPGPNAFIGYDWPLPPEEPPLHEIALRLPALRRAVLSVPGQVDAILAWAAQQRWADPGRVSLLGLSLGAFVAPATQRLVEERGARVGWTILGYAGAPIGAVIAGHPGVRPAWIAGALGAVADLVLRPIEPSVHLPRVHGRFLLLRAGKDRLVAPGAALRLTDLTPEPRKEIVVEGDHMGVGRDRWKLLEQVVALSRAWLVSEGAIVPAGGERAPRPARARPSR
jgi:hypothetical protein